MMEGCMQFSLDEKQIQDLVPQAKDYILSHGLVLRTPEQPESAELVSYVSFLLFPSPVPRRCFEQARTIQKDYNLLMHKIAHDHDFLKECLKSTVKVDDFTGRIWNIYEIVRKEGITQPVCLAMNRSDYMLDCGVPAEQLLASGNKVDMSGIQIKQIEFNTMSSAFGGLSQQLTDYHRYMLELCGKADLAKNVPENLAADGLAEALVTAWKQYANDSAVILFLIDDTERNVYDQRFLEYSVQRQCSSAKVIRRTLKDIQQRASLADNKTLFIDDMEVAIVYQRSCYTPTHFKSEEDWETRLMLERSKAILCPNAAYHLAGTKKVQQTLAKPGMVERFISDPDAAQRIRATFAQQYSLDKGEEGDKTVVLGMAHPEQFVLKPQREGGGNNTFGEEVRSVLEKIKDTDERMAYVLMERIHPAPLRNYPIKAGNDVTLMNLVSELGVFGTLVGTKDNIVLNEQKGHILRTKTVGTDEGGVATGFAALDSPYLI